MPKRRVHRLFTFAAGASAVALTTAIALPAHATGATPHVRVTALVADRAGQAQLRDEDAVNAWGIAFGPNTPVWVADNGTDRATLYSGGVDGSAVSKVPLVVDVAGGAPSGQVFNPTTGFVVHDGATSAPAPFIFSAESGDLTGWAPAVGGGMTAVVAAHTPDAVYKGLAIAMVDGRAFLYATDFHHGRVDVFDDMWHRVAMPGFVDRDVPRGYAPFGIQAIGDRIYVTYAVQDEAAHDDVRGAGHGIVDVFTTTGHLVRRLVSHGALNSPWGLDVAPSSFGRLAGALLVGNFGDGHINAYDRATGAWLGMLMMPNGQPVWIDGLWGLATGNGTFGGTDEVVFTAGPDHESHGEVGVISVAR